MSNIDIQALARQAGIVLYPEFPQGEEQVRLLERFAGLYREALFAELLAGSGELPQPDYVGPSGVAGGFQFHGHSAAAARKLLAAAVLREREKSKALLEACENFVRKCETGAAKSKASYAAMKAAIAQYKGEQA